MHPIISSIPEIFFDIVTILISIFKSLLLLFVQKLDNLRRPAYKDLSNETILITGAGGGLGRLLCLEFAKYYPTLIGWDVNKTALEETARIVNEKYSSVLHTYTCDLRSGNEILHTAKQVLREFGRVTILVNNAGIVTGRRILDSQPSDFEDTFRVNVLAHFHLIKAFLPAMIGSSADGIESLPKGHIVTIASIASFIPGPGLADYCSSKAAALMMSDSLEVELKNLNLEDRINVTRVCPFFLNTRMFEGCRSPLFWLFPTVDAEHCAARIVNAVRTKQRLVFIPRWQWLLPVLYRVFPTETIHNLFDLCGMHRFASQLLEHRENRNDDRESL